MKEKILLLGSKGRLALFIKKIFPESIGYDKDSVDISNKEQITNLIIKEQPTLIINCAALTDIEYCEENPEECWNVNARAVSYIVEAAKQINAKLIHFSSNYILNPINEYSWAKLASETIAAKGGMVIRTDIFDTKTYIINKLLSSNEKLNAFTDKFFNPVYMGTIAQLIKNLEYKPGIINIFANEKISMYDFALMVCEVFNIDKSRVIPTLSNEEIQKAKRPKEIFISSELNLPILEELKKLKKDQEEKQVTQDL